MAEQLYFPLYFNWVEDTKELNAQEKGRLIDAIVLYARGGDWQEQIKGNERYLFPIYQGQIDRQRTLSNVRAEAGAKGGNQKQANSSKNKQVLASDSKDYQDLAKSSKRYQNLASDSKVAKNKNKEKDKEKEIYDEDDKDARTHEESAESVYESTGIGDTYSEEELNENLRINTQVIPEIEKVCRYVGMMFTPFDEDTVRELLANGCDGQMIVDAVLEAKKHNALSWSYIRKVLENRKAGVKDGGKADRSGKRNNDVSAAGRTYTAEDIATNPYLDGTI